MGDHNETVARVQASYAAAVLARDIEAFMNLYDSNVRIFDAWGAWSYEGATQWRSPITAWFASDPADSFKVTFDDVKTWGSEGAATMSAIVSYASVSAQGKQLRSMQNRITWVVQGSGEAAKIVHEHTSAPIGFEDTKAILSHPQWVGS